MKLRSMMIFEAIFYSVLIGAGIFGLCYPEVPTFGKIFISIFMFLMLLMMFFHFVGGPWYQEDKYIHRGAFNKVIACANAFILIDAANQAHIFRADEKAVKKMEQLTHFKGRFFYTLKGEQNASFQWLIYQQLEDLRKGNKDEQFVQDQKPHTSHYDSVG